ncbi:MAG TPA: hypothetical protein V6D17_18065 [Candidatus Obscuribacterales bacterium]
MNDKKEIVAAIQELGNRVMVADVVAKTGLPLEEVTASMNAIASETDANLQVTASGDIFYCFPKHLQYLYLKRGIAKALQTASRTTAAFLYLLFRISFGLTLIFSLICFFGIALIIQTVIAGFMGAGEAVACMWRDFFGLVGRLALTDLVYWGRERKGGQQQGARQGFLLSCFSFLFGEGNPNRHLDEERWKLLAQVVRLNEGVVVAEQLVPYLATEPDDEKAIFQVLAKFNGIPTVSDNGNIVYVFPSLKTRSEIASFALLPPYLEEKPWRFSNLSKETLKPVIAIAIMNFIMSITGAFLLVKPDRQLSTNFLFAFLAVYGTLFVLVPLVRLLIIDRLNKEIGERNQLARRYERLLGNPPPDLARKLDDAEQVRRSDFQLLSGPVVYTTEKDYLEQITDKDFEEELKRSEGSG